ncbi:hypothetical protein AMATHDRAFT_145124 [Amanita thiersii Skay4041]|uniref:NADAR domain-containing protein n=1 Tax=Amanita thiersii Skay4041 TaxID=703135 RepID=A0A2A9NRM5_9AGAR|nr:hypothetical protein AMATHDRAFT_145124 [Amanita thiersii Skay4041]
MANSSVHSSNSSAVSQLEESGRRALADHSVSTTLQTVSPSATVSSTCSSASESPTTSNLITGSSPSLVSPPVQPPFIFTDQALYSGFVNDSPHSIIHCGYTYKTATHLIEAMKYMEIEPVCGDEIRRSKSPDEARQLSAKFEREGKLPADWEEASFSAIESVLYAKFRQHTSLQFLLLNTPDTHLIYHNGDDGYWGDGWDGEGLNMLGRALDAVKCRLKERARERTLRFLQDLNLNAN